MKETNWKEEWFVQYPKGYWTFEKQREFLDNLAKELGISNPEQWGTITNKRVLEHGGGSILTQFGSLWNALRTLYTGLEIAYVHNRVKDIKWEQKWFARVSEHSRGYWLNKENHKKLLQAFAEHNNIKKAQDWGKITVEEFAAFGGGRILQIYRNSLYLTLKSVFIGIKNLEITM